MLSKIAPIAVTALATFSSLDSSASAAVVKCRGTFSTAGPLNPIDICTEKVSSGEKTSSKLMCTTGDNPTLELKTYTSADCTGSPTVTIPNIGVGSTFECSDSAPACEHVIVREYYYSDCKAEGDYVDEAHIVEQCASAGNAYGKRMCTSQGSKVQMFMDATCSGQSVHEMDMVTQCAGGAGQFTEVKHCSSAAAPAPVPAPAPAPAAPIVSPAAAVAEKCRGVFSSVGIPLYAIDICTEKVTGDQKTWTKFTCTTGDNPELELKTYPADDCTGSPTVTIPNIGVGSTFVCSDSAPACEHVIIREYSESNCKAEGDYADNANIIDECLVQGNGSLKKSCTSQGSSLLTYSGATCSGQVVLVSDELKQCSGSAGQFKEVRHCSKPMTISLASKHSAALGMLVAAVCSVLALIV